VHDLLDRSALELGRLVRLRRVSSDELTRLCLDRIERLDPRVHAFVTVLGGAALRDARAKDAALDDALRGPMPAFYGVPTGVKDLDLVRGTFARMGSRAYRYFWSPVDGPVAASIRRGGFVIAGKLSTSEFGALPVTEPDIHAPTRNPWSLDHTAGGSSGGSAAAVAAGLLPIAQGSDGAGSIRIPSSFCNLYGFKPSRTRLPNPYRRIDPIAISAVGPLAHTVEDAAAMVDVLAGRATVDAMRDPASCLEQSRRAPGRLRIKFTTTSPLGAAEPPIAAAVAAAARLLEELGHHVEEGSPPVGSLEEFLPIWQRQVANIPALADRLTQPVTRWLRDEGRRHTRPAIERRHQDLSARVLAWFGDADLWLTPTVPVSPPAIGEWRHLGPEETFHAAARLGPFTAIFNLTGQPAASVPAGLSPAGLPIGVQLAGKPAADGVVLAVSRQLEEAMPWRQRRPSLD
jgi:amidase